MSDLIRVSQDDLRSAAMKLNRAADAMNDVFKRATSLVNSTEEAWVGSSAADNYRSQFNSLTATFPNFIDAVHKYATFLVNTAASWDEAEQSITANAENKLNDGYNA